MNEKIDNNWTKKAEKVDYKSHSISLEKDGK